MEAIKTKAAELRNHQEKPFLLPEHFDAACTNNIPEIQKEISAWVAFFYHHAEVHPGSLQQPVCDFIRQNYQIVIAPTADNFGYGV